MYYPKSQITTDLYTNGNEFIIKNSSKPYVGYYWKNSIGKFFTGKNPQNTPCEELIKNVNNNNNSNINLTYSKIDNPFSEYVKIKNINTSLQKEIPYYIPEYPSEQDYVKGEFNRYFCKKTNEYFYIEINKDLFNKLKNKDPKIEFTLYQPFYINWKLTGNKEDTYNLNKNTVEYNMYKNKLLMFNEYLKKDYIKYWRF